MECVGIVEGADWHNGILAAIDPRQAALPPFPTNSPVHSHRALRRPSAAGLLTDSASLPCLEPTQDTPSNRRHNHQREHVSDASTQVSSLIVDSAVRKEDEAQLCDFEGGNLEIVLREMILDSVPDDISGFKW